MSSGMYLGVSLKILQSDEWFYIESNSSAGMARNLIGCIVLSPSSPERHRCPAETCLTTKHQVNTARLPGPIDENLRLVFRRSLDIQLGYLFNTQKNDNYIEDVRLSTRDVEQVLLGEASSVWYELYKAHQDKIEKMSEKAVGSIRYMIRGALIHTKKLHVEYHYDIAKEGNREAGIPFADAGNATLGAFALPPVLPSTLNSKLRSHKEESRYVGIKHSISAGHVFALKYLTIQRTKKFVRFLRTGPRLDIPMGGLVPISSSEDVQEDTEMDAQETAKIEIQKDVTENIK